MKYLFFILIIVLFGSTSCDPIKRHQRLVERFPYVHTQDTVILIDTMTVLIPKIEHDTIFNLNELHDTVYIEKDRLKIKMFTIHDSIYVEGECDSIYVEKIIERKVPIIHYESKPSWWSWLKWILIATFILSVLYLVFNRKQK